MVAVDVNEARLRTAAELGADHLVNAAEEDPVVAIQRLGGADAAISTAATPKAFEQAIASLARGGSLVCVGLPANNDLVVPIFETVLGGLTVKGSIVGTHHDLEEVFELPAAAARRCCAPSARSTTSTRPSRPVLDGSSPAPRMVFDIAGVGLAERAAIAAAALA